MAYRLQLPIYDKYKLVHKIIAHFATILSPELTFHQLPIVGNVQSIVQFSAFVITLVTARKHYKDNSRYLNCNFRHFKNAMFLPGNT